MQTLQFREKVGADGVLHLEVRDLPRGEEIEAVVVVQPLDGHSNGTSLDWVDALYGSNASDPIERPDQGQWDEREELL